MRFAVVISRYNREVTDGLLAGTLEYFKDQGLPVSNSDIIDAPGAFEIPLIAQAAARTGKFAGIVCLGCVVKGDTAHFEYISESAAHGIMSAGLSTGVPIAFGILTTYTDEQAEIRSRPGKDNKGREAAHACLEAARAISAFNSL